MTEDELQRMLALFEHTSLLVALYDGFDRLRYANAAFREAFFIEPDETPFWPDLMRRNQQLGRGTVIRNVDFEAWLVSTQGRRGKTGFRAFETDLADGRWLWMTETVQNGGWMLCVASDITGVRAEGRQVRQDRDFALRASMTDELTGIANRRFVTTRIDEMLEEARESGETCCLCVLDLDNFKYINDRHGHHVGDIVLRDFARRIQEQVRREDCFGRIGGEEFLLAMPHTSVCHARLLVERMLMAVRGARPLPDQPDFGYSFSAGLATSRPDDVRVALIARADAALYMAKLAGRDRIHMMEDRYATPNGDAA
jgi:diguanylate cyclase (GGDEF)-like protein